MRVKRRGELEHFLGRRYGDFARLHKQLKIELPGKVLPPMPKKNKSSTTATGLFSRSQGDGDDSETSSVSSMSTMPPADAGGLRESMKNLSVRGHRRDLSTASSRNASPRPSMDGPKSPRPDVSCPHNKHSTQVLILCRRHCCGVKASESRSERFCAISCRTRRSRRQRQCRIS